ncbi:hypothetical protein [Erythrobacter sp.]|jgi:hypothetical protein|uniref:hypothetical protein n=1 Tax=Erythrobacter sp. TaxID=1042 RepID=UPI002ED33ED0
MTPPPLAEYPGAEIVKGVTFLGDTGITLERGESGLPVFACWRPILFKEDTDRPVAGRIDCRFIANDNGFSDAALGYDMPRYLRRHPTADNASAPRAGEKA